MSHNIALVSISIGLLLVSSCSQRKTKNNTPPIVESAIVEESSAKAEVIHLRYAKPINGYTVTADVTPYESGSEGEAVLTFSKEDISFSAFVDSFVKDGFNLGTIDKNSEEVVLQYSPKPKGVMLYSKEPFCFSDVDFDGIEEILVLDYGQGVHGVNAYRVFEPDGKLREDAPFKELDEHYEFDAKNKTITYVYHEDASTGPFQDIYKRKKDGSFELIKESFSYDYS